MKTALLLIAHGSRSGEANADLDWLAGALRARGEYDQVVCSYLELASPDVMEGAARCVAAGADYVVMVPYFLSAGMHVTQDLEAARAALQARFPQASFCLAAPIGRHPLMAGIVAERVAEAAAKGRAPGSNLMPNA